MTARKPSGWGLQKGGDAETRSVACACTPAPAPLRGGKSERRVAKISAKADDTRP